jgi:hypothetical protein
MNISEELTNNNDLFYNIENISPETVSSNYVLDQIMPNVMQLHHQLGIIYERDPHIIREDVTNVISIDEEIILSEIFYRLIPPQNRRFNISISMDEEEEKEEKEEKEEECPICFETMSFCFETIHPENKSKVVLDCKHSFCNQCIKKTFTTGCNRNPSCALCRTPITHIMVKNIETFNLLAPHCISVGGQGSSTPLSDAGDPNRFAQRP